MPFNGSGTYAPPAYPAFPAVSGQTIVAAYYNSVINDIAAGLSNTLPRDGQAPATANIPMNSHKFTGMTPGTTAGDSVTYEQLTAITGSLNIPLFAGVTAATIPAGITFFNTTGYSILGKGMGVYVTDASATAALSAVYPALCKQSLDGRYWRFIGSEIPVEAAGTTGTVGVNDQPAIQQAIKYANLFAIQKVKFNLPAYELWCPIRTSDPVYYDTQGHTDGFYMLTTAQITFEGIPGRSVLTCKNSTGGTNDVVTQTVAGTVWRGGAAIALTLDSASAVFVIRNLEIDGTKTYVGGKTNVGSDVYHKGLHANYAGGTWKGLILDNVIVHNFGGELTYMGGQTYSTTISRDVELYQSNQSGWNPSGLGRVYASNLNAHDCYLASEIISGQGHTYVECRFAHAYNCGVIGTNHFDPTYPYSWPFRDTTIAPLFAHHIGTRFEDITVITGGAWMRGSALSIDSSWSFADTSDIDLDIQAWSDQSDGNSIIAVSGPPTLTTQWPGAPAGKYYPQLSNVRINLVHQRTAYNKLTYTGNLTAVRYQGGLIDRDSVRITVQGEYGSLLTYGTTPPAGYGQFLFEAHNVIGTGYGQPNCGLFDTPGVNTAYTLTTGAMAIAPTVAGPIDFTLTNTWKYANGQRMQFLHVGTTGNKFRFKAGATGLLLDRDYVCINRGDLIEFEYDKIEDKWRLLRFASAAVTLDYNPITAVGAGTYTLIDSDKTLRCSVATTLTLPDPTKWANRPIRVSNLTALAVSSATSNVCPIGSATPGTAILAASAGKWVDMISDGVNWLVIAGN